MIELEGAGTRGVKLFDVWIRILLYGDNGALLIGYYGVCVWGAGRTVYM